MNDSHRHVDIRMNEPASSRDVRIAQRVAIRRASVVRDLASLLACDGARSAAAAFRHEGGHAAQGKRMDRRTRALLTLPFAARPLCAATYAARVMAGRFTNDPQDLPVKNQRDSTHLLAL